MFIHLNANSQTVSIPYSNNFDNLATDTVGWSHYADSGTDDWEVGDPNYSWFGSSYSNPNAWKTDLDNSYATFSDRSLETPYFDLSDTITPKVLSLYHKTRASWASFKIEYKIGSNGIWLLLDNTASPKKNWQSGGNGFSNTTHSFRHSNINLSFIQGQDSLKFRFRFVSNQGTNNGGWMIDNFSIQPEYINVYAAQGDTIRSIHKYSPSFKVVSDYIFSNQYNHSYYFTDSFFFSTDNILDINDLFLGTNSHWENDTENDYDHTLNLPMGLNALQPYYIFYKYDANNVLVENNESDNINYTVLLLDSIYESNYIEDFEDNVQKWNNSRGEKWSFGAPDNWHVESARSGKNAWLSGEEILGNASLYMLLESPFLDLTYSVNSSLCFWYKTSRSWASNNFKIYMSDGGIHWSGITNYNQVSNIVRESRYYGWDCHCESISSYDGDSITRFGFSAYGDIVPTQLNQVLIDDIYIGTAKPDAGIGGERDNRFTSSSQSSDNLTYMLFNSGLAQLPSTTTAFYWSNDSILDASDVYLGSQTEPSILDTSFLLRTLNYTKPTLIEGEYFILYSLDDSSVVDEMREYDNIGYFRINQTNQATLPYYNDFESSINGWRHSATFGNDDWEWDIPNGIIIDSAFSGQKAFITDADDTTSWRSRMHLYTPVFDLTELQNPVMEFDLLNAFYGYNNYNYWPYNLGNMMYSIDGGNSWQLLDTPTESYKRWYGQIEIDEITGNESRFSPTISSTILYDKRTSSFRTQLDYQGRDYDDNTHYVLNLSHLQNQTQIQFMIVYANLEAPSEGMMLDNFEIKQAANDLVVTSNKKLMVSSADVELKTFFSVKNDNNHLANESTMRVYVSTDSLLGANDSLLHIELIPELHPYEKHLVNLVMPTPSNYSQYNYLLYELDAYQQVPEINEMNNIGYLELNMDTASHFNYPVLFDFSDEEIDGWTWWHDSLGSYHGHRFRHKNVIKEWISNYTDSESWFLDGMAKVGYIGWSSYPNHYLEPPSFDFTNLAKISMTFDYMSAAGGGSPIDTQSGNISYSIDGGSTWILLDYSQDPNAQNWYHPNYGYNSLGGDLGWVYKSDWTPAVYNLSFLAGEPNVRFRYRWRSKIKGCTSCIQGFRLDNFQIDGQSSDLIANSSHPTIPIDFATQSSLAINYTIENTGDINNILSKTGFYWSTDSILDANDLLLGSIQEPPLTLNSPYIGTYNINFPSPITQACYYILYLADSDNTTNESNESNNLGWCKLEFNDSNVVDLEIIPALSQVTTSIIYSDFNFDFNFINNGDMDSDSALISIHWSTDSILSVDDTLMISIDEPGIQPSAFISHTENIIYPQPVLQSPYYLLISTDVNNQNNEVDETNNFIWIQIHFDSTGLGIDDYSVLDVFSLIAGKEILELTHSGENDGMIKVRIHDITGKEILSKESLILAKGIIEIQRPPMATGFYFLTVQKENKYYTFKIHHYSNY